MTSKIKTLFINGILLENPVLRLIIGVCPTLAVTTMAFNGLGMGLAATFVLICSNIVVSALRNVIPSKVRIPAYITIIATFVTLVMMLVEAYVPALDEALGIFLPLIVVNCIILGRAEMYASKNPVLLSAVDGLAMGIGFTITLVLMAGIRELFGFGTLFSYPITKGLIEPVSVLTTPAGGFFVYGILIALALQLEKIPFFGKAPQGAGCAACPSKNVCMSAEQSQLNTAVSENVEQQHLPTDSITTTFEQADNQKYNAEVERGEQLSAELVEGTEDTAPEDQASDEQAKDEEAQDAKDATSEESATEPSDSDEPQTDVEAEDTEQATPEEASEQTDTEETTNEQETPDDTDNDKKEGE